LHKIFQKIAQEQICPTHSILSTFFQYENWNKSISRAENNRQIPLMIIGVNIKIKV
jgi:hypothetical protein